jgi:hypothetical protein
MEKEGIKGLRVFLSEKQDDGSLFYNLFLQKQAF